MSEVLPQKQQMETGTQGDALQSLSLWDRSLNTGREKAEAAFSVASCAAPTALEQGMGLMPLAGLASSAVSPFRRTPLEKRKHIPVQKVSTTWGLTAFCRAMGVPTTGQSDKE